MLPETGTAFQEKTSIDDTSTNARVADGNPRSRQSRPPTDANVGAVDANKEELELPESSITGSDETRDSGGNSGGDGDGDGGSLSSSSATRSLSPLPPPQPRSVIVPQHGHDMSILTVGRIGDGFRRDAYAFDVDLKGRGEERAAEARAVLQVRRDVSRAPFPDSLGAIPPPPANSG